MVLYKPKLILKNYISEIVEYKGMLFAKKIFSTFPEKLMKTIFLYSLYNLKNWEAS